MSATQWPAVPATNDQVQVQVHNLRPSKYDGPQRATFDARLVLSGGQGSLTIKNCKLLKHAEPGGFWVSPPNTRKERGPGFHNFAEFDGPWTAVLLREAVRAYSATH